MKYLRFCAFLLSLLVAAAPARAAAPVLTLHRALIERMIQTQFDPSQADPSFIYAGNISVGRRGANSMWLRIPMKAQGLSIFTVQVALDFLCRRGRMHVLVADWELLSGVSVLVDTVPFVMPWLESNVSDALNANLLPAVDLDMECPGIEVLSSGAMQFDFGPGDQCQNGATRTQPCLAGATGPGTVFRCANGRWEVDTFECEAPSAP